ncbi:diacylglycerol kinase [Pneumocystis jirovecii RU7]|uniref:Uncharacterized protein n=1 Tax=Pneumocystis jirovecii (strain RU7) TaxID=1408657 RepID=A0A0W4ZTV5_PNEJ7|nr:diacylglycerol kinase [Pneumocystis jirovecii RU7]KTW31779.1 hypothetical protein T551_01040 [Pneumocystis jirovecii RU7]
MQLYAQCARRRAAGGRGAATNGDSGVIPYLIGTWTVLVAYPRDIAVVSILVLAWSDTAASTVGRVSGSVGAAVAGMLVAYVFWGRVARADEPGAVWRPGEGVSIHGLAVVTGMVGAFAEQVDVWGLNDNCVIPIVSGGLLYVFLRAAAWWGGREAGGLSH